MFSPRVKVIQVGGVAEASFSVLCRKDRYFVIQNWRFSFALENSYL